MAGRFPAALLLTGLLALALNGPITQAQEPEGPAFFLLGVDTDYANGKVVKVCITYQILNPLALGSDFLSMQDEDCFDKPALGKAVGPFSIDDIGFGYLYVYAYPEGPFAKTPCVSLWAEFNGIMKLQLNDDLPLFDSCEVYDFAFSPTPAWAPRQNP